MNIFYTYLWLRENGTPYYVGKGYGERAFRRGSPFKERILIQEFPTEQDAFFAEKFLITYYGRKDLGLGCLTNLTDGGEGSVGYRHVDNAIYKMREACKNRIPPMLGHVHSIESRKRMSEAHKKRKRAPRSDETRCKISKTLMGHVGVKHSFETKAKIAASLKGHIVSEETRRKIGLAKKGEK